MLRVKFYFIFYQNDVLTNCECFDCFCVGLIYFSVLQQNRLRWACSVKEDNEANWVKKCMEYEVEGARSRGRPKKTWRERFCKKTVRHVNWTGRMPWIVIDGGGSFTRWCANSSYNSSYNSSLSEAGDNVLWWKHCKRFPNWPVFYIFSDYRCVITNLLFCQLLIYFTWLIGSLHPPSFPW